jgi:PAS domain S-box-containing protein
MLSESSGQDGASAVAAHGPDVGVGRARLLLVDDDFHARGALGQLLRADGFVVTMASDGEDALTVAGRSLPDLVLTDLEMPRMDGVALCKRLHELDPALPVIVMTGHSDTQSAIESLRAGAEDYLVKPLQYEAVLWRVRRTIAARAATHELAALQRVLHDRLVASSASDREHAAAAAAQRAQLEALLLNLQEGVAIVEPTGRIVMANAASRAILGTGSGDEDTFAAIRALTGDALLESGQPVAQPLFRRALHGERFVDHEVGCTRPDGGRRRLAATGASVRDEHDRVVLAVIVFRDITDSRRHEEEREEYLALVSHDLLNPLSNILMCASLLKAVLRAKDSRWHPVS